MKEFVLRFCGLYIVIKIFSGIFQGLITLVMSVVLHFKKMRKGKLHKVLHYLLATASPPEEYALFEECPYTQNDICRVWNCPAYCENSKLRFLCTAKIKQKRIWKGLFNFKLKDKKKV